MRSKKLISFALVLAVMATVFAVTGHAADAAGIRAGEYYYLRNVGSGRYMDVKSGVDANFTDVITYPYNGGKNQQFRVLHPGDNYKFVARCSSANRVLDISSGNVDIYTDSNAAYQQFSVVRLSDGTYNIKNGSNYMIDNTSTNSVIMSSSSNGNYSRWAFEKVSKGDADIYSFSYTGYDSTSANTEFKNSANAMGYSAYSYVNTSADNALTNMLGDDIWVHRGRGAAGNLYFNTSTGATNGSITIAGINGLATNGLSSMRVFISTGSYTGNDTNGNPTSASNNLVKAAYNKGAHYAIGFREAPGTSLASTWVQCFITRADDGVSVGTCVEYADYWASTGDKYAIGDTNQKLT